ncbi:MAG: PQQ-binding-like beta-propeller repeat protein [Polyangiaceae bacterium]
MEDAAPVLLDEPATALALDATYAFAGRHGAVHVYDVARGVSVTQYELSEAAISALVRLPGALLVVGTGALDGRVFVVDVAQAKVVHRIDAHQEAFGCTSLACEPRGRLFASGSDDGTVALVDPAKGRVLARVRLTETPVSLAFDPTGRKLAAVLANGTAVVVSLDQKAAVSTLDVPHAARVTWSDALVIGLTDGRLERASFGAPPAKAPVAPRAR